MKFRELRVVTDKKGKIIKKEPTEREFVMISAIDAKIMNTDFAKTKLFYEPVKEKAPEPKK